jgi:Ala-tRNA(Pro) deacylase
MTALQRCLELLDENEVPYTHTKHTAAYRALEVAEAEHLPPHMLAKTVVFRAGGGFALAVLPADCKVDLEELARTLNLAQIRLATEDEVRAKFPESEVGAMPPFGSLFDVPVYLDARLADQSYIFFNAGTHRDAIHMSFANYARLADPLITRFAHRELAYA